MSPSVSVAIPPVRAEENVSGWKLPAFLLYAVATLALFATCYGVIFAITTDAVQSEGVRSQGFALKSATLLVGQDTQRFLSDVWRKNVEVAAVTRAFLVEKGRLTNVLSQFPASVGLFMRASPYENIGGSGSFATCGGATRNAVFNFRRFSTGSTDRLSFGVIDESTQMRSHSFLLTGVTADSQKSLYVSPERFLQEHVVFPSYFNGTTALNATSALLGTEPFFSETTVVTKWTEPELVSLSGMPALYTSVGTNFMDRNGSETLGVALTSISLLEVDAALRGRQVGENGLVFVVSDQNKVVASNREHSPGEYGKVPDAGTLLGQLLAANPPLDVVTSTIHGHRSLISKLDVPGLNWRIVAIIPDSDFIDTHVTTAITIWMTSAFVVFAILIVLMTVKASRSVKDLVHSLHTVSSLLKKNDIDSQEFEPLQSNVKEVSVFLSHYNTVMTQALADRKSLLRSITQLKEMAKIADEASSMRERFVSNMSHEVRTPLNGIINGIELLKRTNDPRKAEQLLNMIHSCGESLHQVLVGVLDFSKIKHGHITPTIETTSLPLVMENIANVVSHLVTPKTEVVLNYHPYIPDIFLDRSFVQQIILNLITNGIKFTPTGHVVATITFEDSAVLRVRVEDTGFGFDSSKLDYLMRPFTRLELAPGKKVAGNGLGLYMVHCMINLLGGRISCSSKIGKGSTFEVILPVKTVDVAMSQPQPQPHVAPVRMVFLATNPKITDFMEEWYHHCVKELSIVDSVARAQAVLNPTDIFVMDEPFAPDLDRFSNHEHVVLLMRQRSMKDILERPDVNFLRKPVTVRSLQQQISSLYTPTPEMQVSITNSWESKGQELSKSDFQCNVLVVEDNEFNRLVITSLLADVCNISEAADGKTAVDVFLQQHALKPFELILMDFFMPGCDGFETTKRIREIERAQGWPRVLIIGVTASVNDADSQQFLANGGDRIMQKPINPKALLAEVASLKQPAEMGYDCVS